MESHHFSSEISTNYKWLCSRTMLNYQRVTLINCMVWWCLTGRGSQQLPFGNQTGQWNQHSIWWFSQWNLYRTPSMSRFPVATFDYWTMKDLWWEHALTLRSHWGESKRTNHNLEGISHDFHVIPWFSMEIPLKVHMIIPWTKPY